MSDFKTSELRDTSQELQELRKQLAASQAREQQLRGALADMCHEFRGHDLPYGSKAYARATTVLNRFLTPDTQALEALIEKASDAMKERAIYFGLAGNTIRALPSITLEDIIK